MLEIVRKIIAKKRIRSLDVSVNELESLTDDELVKRVDYNILNDLYLRIGIEVVTVGHDLNDPLIVRVKNVFERYKSIMENKYNCVLILS